MLMLIAEMNAVAVVVVTTSFYRMNDLEIKIKSTKSFVRM